MSIEEAEEKIKALEEENKKLKEQISNDSWQYEADHKDDWRKPIEMGQL